MPEPLTPSSKPAETITHYLKLRPFGFDLPGVVKGPTVQEEEVSENPSAHLDLELKFRTHKTRFPRQEPQSSVAGSGAARVD